MSIWNWADWITPVASENRVTLGEGNTPLIRSRRIGPSVGLSSLYFKLESSNPELDRSKIALLPLRFPHAREQIARIASRLPVATRVRLWQPTARQLAFVVGSRSWKLRRSAN